ncbi:MAG: protein kinase [Acidobacteriaceae bacterium]|nr:protein kinase [Acidobacteriaceae bacterium]
MPLLSFNKVKSRYVLKEKLGAGGMGVIYRARDTVISADVALKTLEDITDPIALRMFHEECDKLAKIVHPNVVEIRDVGEIETGGVRKPYLVMPFLRGRTLDSLILDWPGGLALERALEILLQASRGLQATHDAGLIHRDIKPSNIFVLEDDSVKLIDFGVAHYAENLLTATRKGTLMYMAPEQVAMRGISPLSDIFSLGVVAYETLTGRRPFEGGTEKQLVETILRRNPQPASRFSSRLSSAVDQTLQKALAKLPEHRFQSAREFGETLRKAALNQPIAIFDPARIEARLEQARSALARGDLDLTGDILNQLELQGFLDDRISDVKQEFERFRDQRIVSSLLASARARIEAQEHGLAFEKIEEALRLDPCNSEAAELREEVERQRAGHIVKQRLAAARQLAENRRFGRAKELVEEALEIFPNEAGALNLRSEIQRSEQGYNVIRYQRRCAERHAEQAINDSDPARALGLIKRAIDLDRQAPEPGKTESNLESLYSRIHAASQDAEQSLARARGFFQAGDFAEAVACCDQALARFPDHDPLRILKLDAESAKLQQTADLIAQTEREILAETDLNRRIELLKSAGERFPQVEHFTSSYRAACEKRDFLESRVAKARSAEQEHRLGDALAGWKIVRAIHPGYPGLDTQIDRLEHRKDLQTDYDLRKGLLDQIRNAIAANEFAGALHLIDVSGSKFAGDPEFAELRSVAESGAEREERAGHFLDEAARLAKERQYDQALSKLDEAGSLDLRLKEIAATRHDVLVEQARSLLGADRRRAEELLRQAVGLAPHGRNSGKKLLKVLEEGSRREHVTEASDSVFRLPTVHNFDAISKPVGQAVVENFGDRVKERTDPEAQHIEQQPRAPSSSPHTSGGRALLQAAWEKASAIVRRRSPNREISTNSGHIRQPLMTASSPNGPSYEADPNTGGVVLAEKTPVSRSTPRSSDLEDEPVSFPAPARHRRVKSSLIALITGTVAAAITFALMLPRRKPALIVPSSVPVSALVHTSLATLPLHVAPLDAQLTVDGSPVSVRNGMVAVQPGTHLFEVRSPGYRPFSRSVEVGTGNNPVLNVALAPLSPAIHVETDLQSGSVLIDDRPAGALEAGQFTSDAPQGSHIIGVVTPDGGRYYFPFTLGQNPLWTITAPKSSSYGTPVFAALGPTGVRIVCGRHGLAFQLDDDQPKACGTMGTNLPVLADGNHTLTILDGSRAVSEQNLNYQGNPVLAALVMTGAQFGGLAIQGNQDQFDVAVDGYTSKRPAENGRWRRLLKPGDYTIAISKPGFTASPSSVSVSIKPGVDLVQQVSFLPVPVLASLRLHSQAGTEVFLNGRTAGTVPANGVLEVHQLPAGSVDVRLQQKGFVNAQQSFVLVAGENEHTVMLQKLMAKIGWTVDPPDAQLTYMAQGNAVPHPLTGNSIELSPGTYYFQASAPGHVSAGETLTVNGGETRNFSLRLDVPRPKVSGFIDAWQGWEQENGWLVREKPGPIFYSLPEHISRITFSAQWERQKTLVHWSGSSLNLVFRSSDATRSITFRIAEHGISWTTVVRGERQEGKLAFRTGKNPEVIQADLQPSGVALTVNGTALPMVATALYSGSEPVQFGFIMEPDQVVRLRGVRIAAAAESPTSN